MSANTKSISNNACSKKSTIWTIVLIAFGVAALYGGAKWLGLLVPAAIVIWLVALPAMQTARD